MGSSKFKDTNGSSQLKASSHQNWSITMKSIKFMHETGHITIQGWNGSAKFKDESGSSKFKNDNGVINIQ